MRNRLTLCTLWLFVMAGVAESKEMSVQVRQGQVRQTPSFLGRVLTTLAYGQRVTVGEERDAWVKLAAGHPVEGWMHLSALTPKQIILQAGAEDRAAGATSDEIALAGKGFNAQVEATYRARNQKMNYLWIDRMEGFGVPQAHIAAFVSDGDLRPAGGAQ